MRFALFGVLVTSVATAGCMGCGGGDSPYFGTTERSASKELTTFYVNNGSEPEYIDPGKAHDSASSALVEQMFEGLTVWHWKDLHPVQGVAMRWDQSEDNRLFRFYLRPEAKWSDGKPVTAHDFEYAWRRVLTPAIASLAAANLYALKNAEVFNLGKLKVVKGDATLRAAAASDAAAVARLPKGTPVQILATSPLKVGTAITPLKSPPAPTVVTHTKADDKKKTPEQLSFAGGMAPMGPAPDGGWKGSEVVVLRQLSEIDCNGGPDFWFEVGRGAERGFLPGCVLSPIKSDKSFALVKRKDRPTYQPGSGAGGTESSVGFIEASELVEDDSVLGVRASDDLTLDVELERPTPYFTDLTSFATLYPVRKDVVEKFEKRGEAELWVRPENIVVNGPYMLDQWKFRYEITMKRNPHYWDKDRLKIHRIVWLEVEEYNATMNLYKGGDIDYIGANLSLPSEYMPFLSTKKDFYRTWYLSTYWYEFNTRKPPVDDVRVRRALNLAVDKQQLIDKITRAGQAPATHYIPDYTGLGYAEQAAEDKAAGVDPFSSPEYVYNPERARALLKDAGYQVVREGDGFRAVGFPPLEILYNTSEGHKQIAVAIQDMWKRHLGISCTLRNEEWKVMLKNNRDGQYQVVRMGWVADYNHANTWLDTFLSYSPQNKTGWADKEFDDLVRKAAATPDQKESIKLFRQAEKRAVDGMAKMPLYFYTKSTLIKPWIKGWIGNPRNVALVKYYWIDPGWREHAENEPAFQALEFPKTGRLVAEGQPSEAQP